MGSITIRSNVVSRVRHEPGGLPAGDEELWIRFKQLLVIVIGNVGPENSMYRPKTAFHSFLALTLLGLGPVAQGSGKPPVRPGRTEAAAAPSPRVVNGVHLGPGAMLAGQDLRGQDLRGEDLRGATLVGANLEGARLEGADLRDADCTLAVFSNARLVGTRFGNARVLGATFGGDTGLDLKGALPHPFFSDQGKPGRVQLLWSYLTKPLHLGRWDRAMPLVADVDPASGWAVVAAEGGSWFMLKSPEAQQSREVAMAAEAKVRRVAVSPTGRLYWTDCVKPSSLFIYGPGPDGRSQVEEVPFPAPAGARPVELFSLTVTPDGVLWITDPAGCRLISLATRPDGLHKVEVVPLAEGLRPMDWIRAPGGRLLFTVADQPLVGSVRWAAEPPAAPAAAGGAGTGFEVEPYQARPDLRAEARAARLRDRKAREAAAEARARAWAETEANLPVPGTKGEEAAPDGHAAEPGPAPAAPAAGPAAAPAAPSADPGAVLAELGVNLSRWAMDHVQGRHGRGARGRPAVSCRSSTRIRPWPACWPGA